MGRRQLSRVGIDQAWSVRTWGQETLDRYGRRERHHERYGLAGIVPIEGGVDSRDRKRRVVVENREAWPIWGTAHHGVRAHEALARGERAEVQRADALLEQANHMHVGLAEIRVSHVDARDWGT